MGKNEERMPKLQKADDEGANQEDLSEFDTARG